MFTMKITIFAIGKIKEKYLKDGINEYLLRLKNYVDIDIVELADSLGGIALVPDSDEEVADSEAELSSEEVISIEDSDEEE